MLLKKLIFLAIPLVVVYWRSRTAQSATRWLFRGVVPEDGPLGKVFSELRAPAERPAPDTRAPRPGAGEPGSRPLRKQSAAARAAEHWPVVLAFVCGVTITAVLFARWSAFD